MVLIYGMFTWQGALNYCASLGSGWKLPSDDELWSLYNNNLGSILPNNIWGYWSSTESSSGLARSVAITPSPVQATANINGYQSMALCTRTN